MNYEVFLFQCEPDGEYYPRQCNVRTKECWCVDHETGVEIKVGSVSSLSFKLKCCAEVAATDLEKESSKLII